VEGVLASIAIRGRQDNVRVEYSGSCASRSFAPSCRAAYAIELQLALLAVLEERLGPQTRNLMRKMQFGDLLTYAGGARVVLAQALARLRKRQFDR
jgi:hypothetical protein